MSEIIKKLDVLEGGLRISHNKRNLSGCIRFNCQNKKFEVCSGEIDCEGNLWSNINPRIASTDSIGLVKIGNNLIINPDTGKLDSVSTSKSQIYQHIIHVSPNFIEGSSSADFISLSKAIDFIRNLDYEKFSRNQFHCWIINLCPGLYTEDKIIVLPPFVSIIGYGNENTILNIKGIKVSTNSSIKNLAINFTGNDNLIEIDTTYIDKKLDYHLKGNDINLAKNDNVLLENLEFEDINFLGENFIYLANGNLSIRHCNFDIHSKSETESNFIKSEISNKINLDNIDLTISSFSRIIDCSYNDIEIKNSKFQGSCDACSIKNLYSNIEIYNSFFNIDSDIFIDNLEDKVFYVELIEKIVVKEGVINIEFKSPILNGIKGLKINDIELKVLKNSENNLAVEYLYTEKKLDEGIYEDVIVEILYLNRFFNTFFKGKVKSNSHYYIEKY